MLGTVVVMWVSNGDVMSVYNLLLSMVWASSCVVSISGVRIVCPYVAVSVVFRVFWMILVFSLVGALEL